MADEQANLEADNDREEQAWRDAYDRTRKSLIERLGNWEDQKSWNEFYQRYWRLIYGVALKSGLRSEEAMDVVQETIITIAKQQKEHRYDPKAGTFKNWLLSQARWRIADQFRRRSKDLASARFADEDDDRNTATMDRYEDPDSQRLEALWDAEWKKNLTDRALAMVKTKVSPKQFQIFDCYVVKGWSVREVTSKLGVSIGQVYLSKHRVGSLMRKQVQALEKELL